MLISFDSNILTYFLEGNGGSYSRTPSDPNTDQRIAAVRLFFYFEPVIVPTVRREATRILEPSKREEHLRFWLIHLAPSGRKWNRSRWRRCPNCSRPLKQSGWVLCSSSRSHTGFARARRLGLKWAEVDMAEKTLRVRHALRARGAIRAARGRSVVMGEVRASCGAGSDSGPYVASAPR